MYNQPRYDVAQICINGHVINDSSRAYPADNADYCKKCGKNTITQCAECQTPIRGYLHGSGVIGLFYPPSYCHNCGKPYPWTKASQDAAIELAKFLDIPELEALFSKDMEHLSSETPKTQVVALKVKAYAEKAGVTVKEMFRGILIEVLAEAAKRIIYPDKP